MKPIRDFIAVTKDEPQKKTTGGIYMPDVAEDKVITGTVVAVGSGHLTKNGESIPLEITQGDKVVFNRSSAVEVRVDDKPILLVREENLLCKL